jgi:hypothetical protein
LESHGWWVFVRKTKTKWVKQCHKPPMTGNSLYIIIYIPHKNDDLGLVYWCLWFILPAWFVFWVFIDLFPDRTTTHADLRYGNPKKETLR